ncbi:MAG: hypothetical protein WD627_05660 [Actinomycetota bacterium]
MEPPQVERRLETWWIWAGQQQALAPIVGAGDFRAGLGLAGREATSVAITMIPSAAAWAKMMNPRTIQNSVCHGSSHVLMTSNATAMTEIAAASQRIERVILLVRRWAYSVTKLRMTRGRRGIPLDYRREA